MKNLKTTVSILLALCMMLTLAPMAGAEEPDLSQRVDLVFYVMGDSPKDETVVEDAINAVLLEKFNATVDFRFSTWTDFQQKYNNELTSGGADLIYIANWLNYGLLAKAGAFLELDDLLDTYAPELRDRAGEDTLNMCRIDGELYAIPALWPEYVPLGIKYREDLRVAYDLPVPDSIEAFETYILGIQENDPEQPLLRPTSAESANSLSVAFDMFNIMNIKYPWVNSNGLVYGLTANYDTPSDLYDYWNSPEFIEDCKLMKKWVDLGFWSKSALSDTNDAEAFDNGVCVAQVAGMNPAKHIASQQAFDRDHPEWESGYYTYGEATGVMYPGHATQNGTALVRGSKNPERAMMVLNYMMMDETMNRLVQCGIEGTHYELVDGIYNNLTDAFLYENLNTWNLRVNEFKLVQATDVIMNEMFAKYDAISEKTKFPGVHIYGGFTEDYDAYSAERTAVSNVMRQYLAPIQAGLVDDVEVAVADFLQRVEAAGLQKCRDGFSAQWTAYCEEYGYQ